MNYINFFLLGRNVEHLYFAIYSTSHIRNVYRHYTLFVADTLFFRKEKE